MFLKKNLFGKLFDGIVKAPSFSQLWKFHLQIYYLKAQPQKETVPVFKYIFGRIFPSFYCHICKKTNINIKTKRRVTQEDF